MVNIFEIVERFRFWNRCDRIGPDIPVTHWKLYFKTTMMELCSKKFHHFGDRSEFRPGAYAINCSRISIGNDVIIRPGTFLFADDNPSGGKIWIEDKVLIGSGVHLYTNNHLFSEKSRPIFNQGYPNATENNSIVLETGCWIGACAVLLPGVRIGRNSVVGAGAVVTRSVPRFSIAVGVPARVKPIK